MREKTSQYNGKAYDKRLRRSIKAIAKGKESALREFFGLYGRMIYAIARAFRLCHEEADEAVNDVLVRVWRSAADVGGGDPYRWLYRVTVNVVTDKLRSRGRNVCSSDALRSDMRDPRDCYGVADDAADFSLHIACLSEKERLIMICRFVEDMTFERIAALTGDPIGTVTSMYYRALNKVKENL